MRSPARTSVDAEAIEAELVCKRAYVGDLVDHATAMVPIRPPIPRTIVRHMADAQFGVQLLAWPPHETTAGRAVQREDREPLWITPNRERERPTIRRLECPKRLAHESSIAVRLGAQDPPKSGNGNSVATYVVLAQERELLRLGLDPERAGLPITSLHRASQTVSVKVTNSELDDASVRQACAGRGVLAPHDPASLSIEEDPGCR
jgi:hypothetical protein